MESATLLSRTAESSSANKIKHLVRLAQDGYSGSLLTDIQTLSTSLFSDPRRKVHNQLLQRGAVPTTAAPSDADDAPSLLLPALEIFQQQDPANGFRGLDKVIHHASNQAVAMVSKWYRQHSLDYTQLERIKKGNPEYGQRITHLSKREYKAPHKGFDLPPKLVMKFSPTAFLLTHLPFNQEALSKY
jgi:hypothetical protein